MIASNKDYTNSAWEPDPWVTGIMSIIDVWPDLDGGWWENLLAFMWRLYIRLMPQDGAKRKPPLVAKPESMKRLTSAMPEAVHGPIHYWSGHV